MKKNKLIKSVLVMLSIGLTLGLAGCSNGDSKKEATGESANEFEGQELKLLFSGAPLPQEKEFYINEYIPEFEEEYGVKVNIDFVAQADGITKIQTEQESGNTVTDVLYVDTANMAPYINGEWVEDISSIVEKSGNTYTDMFEATTNKDGKQYFVPNSFDVYLVAVNKKALQYLPSELKEEDVLKGITWDQYSDWAVNIAEGEGVGKTMFPTNMTGSQLLYPLGGLGISYGATFPEFSSKEFQEAMTPIAKMSKGNAFYPEQNQYIDPTDPLKSGAVWLTFAHMAPIGAAYNAAPNDYIVAPAPKGPKGAGSTAGAWTYGIQKDAPNRKLAEKFLEFTMEPENNYNMNVGMGGMLSPIEEVSDLLESGDVIMQAGANMLEDTIISGVPSTEYTDWNAVKLLYGNLFEEIEKNKDVPETSYFEGLQSDLDSYLQK